MSNRNPFFSSLIDEIDLEKPKLCCRRKTTHQKQIDLDVYVKIEMLGVPKKNIEKYGAVSAQTAKTMAQGVCKITGASIGISATGIAGPSGGTKTKPVGLVYLGIADDRGVKALKYQMPGTRDLIKRRTSEAALYLLWRNLKQSRFD